MEEFVVDKDIRIADRPSGSRQRVLRLMEVGDSIHFNQPSRATNNHYAVAARNLGMKIAVRKDGDGSRMWRIA